MRVFVAAQLELHIGSIHKIQWHVARDIMVKENVAPVDRGYTCQVDVAFWKKSTPPFEMEYKHFGKISTAAAHSGGACCCSPVSPNQNLTEFGTKETASTPSN
uniref:Uncharacterized protein n=1 Tax=Oryza barthii TaxID=65489 RepID=A0A0D3FCX0_9ORYZ